jgi:hypothetical protein
MGHAGKDMSDIYHKIKKGRGVPQGIDGAEWFGAPRTRTLLNACAAHASSN